MSTDTWYLCTIKIPTVYPETRRFKDHNLISQSFRRALVVGGAVQGVAVLCDILITGGLCYYFTTSRAGHRTTNTLLDRLMAHAIERGALTA